MKLIALAGILLLAGCMASPSYRHTAFQNACAGYGFVPGSEAYGNCLMKQDLAFQRRIAQ